MEFQYLTLSLVPFVFPVFLHEILLKSKHQRLLCILLDLRILKHTKNVEFVADLAEIFKFKHNPYFSSCFHFWDWRFHSQLLFPLDLVALLLDQVTRCVPISADWQVLFIYMYITWLTDQWPWSIECKTFQIQIALI